MPEPRMTKGEREDLQRLIRQREKVAKSEAKRRSAELMANFVGQMNTAYHYDDDAVWSEAECAVEAAVAQAAVVVAARCRELGSPAEFQPRINSYWSGHTAGSLTRERRRQLRELAESRIAALEQMAIAQIERASVEAQTKVALAGLTSEAAVAFAAALPPVERLMPALAFDEVAKRLSLPSALAGKRAQRLDAEAEPDDDAEPDEQSEPAA